MEKKADRTREAMNRMMADLRELKFMTGIRHLDSFVFLIRPSVVIIEERKERNASDYPTLRAMVVFLLIGLHS